MTIELAFCEQTILAEIDDPSMKQIDISKTYALALKSSEQETIDWPKINAAIIKRWSRSGLKRIKDDAWSGKCFAEDKP